MLIAFLFETKSRREELNVFFLGGHRGETISAPVITLREVEFRKI